MKRLLHKRAFEREGNIAREASKHRERKPQRMEGVWGAAATYTRLTPRPWNELIVVALRDKLSEENPEVFEGIGEALHAPLHGLSVPLLYSGTQVLTEHKPASSTVHDPENETEIIDTKLAESYVSCK